MSDWEEPEQCDECGEFFLPEEDEDGDHSVVCDDCKG